MKALDGFHIVSMAINVPGPVAAAGLRDLGARVTKVEPPAGDPLAQFSASWYATVCAGMDVVTLDLKSSAGMAGLHALLADADLFLTATRPAALERLGLDWPRLQAINSNLCHVGITGYGPPREEEAGHDLTCQAQLGTLQPPELPRVLLADMAGAQQAVAAGLALLLTRERGGGAGQAWVALAESARAFAVTIRENVTGPDAMLGGGLAAYNLYATRDGHIALAALEPHFFRRLQAALGVETVTTAALQARFARETSAHWEAWAAAHGIPLAEVR